MNKTIFRSKDLAFLSCFTLRKWFMLFFIAAITVYSLAECFLETHSEFVFQHFFNIFHPCRPVEPRSNPALELSSQLYSILFLFPPTFNNNQNFTFSGNFCLQEKKCFHATNFTTQIYQTNTYDFTFASHSEVSKCWGLDESLE